MVTPRSRTYTASSGVGFGAGRFSTSGAAGSLAVAAAVADFIGGLSMGISLLEPPTSGGLTITSLRGGSAGLKAFGFGQAFRQGDVPAGQSLSNLQVTPRNYHPDGSVAFAHVAGVATISAGTDRPVALMLGTPLSGTALSTSDLQATGVAASIDCGAFGSVSWTGADWAASFVTWVSGPAMSSWIFRKPVGSDPHLVAWLEVRLYYGGAVEVIPWLENGFLTGTAHTNKSAIYTFSLGGTQRYTSGTALDIKHHQRVVLLSGSATSHWLGTDPGIFPIHDQNYLEATEAVPAYYGTMAAGATEVTQLPTTFTPLAQGVFNYGSDSMASSGFQEPIGLLPQHDAISMTCADADRVTAVRAVIHGGYSAGRYGIHFRDATTNRVPRLTDYPTLVLRDAAGVKDTGASTTSTYSPTVTGGNAPQWDPSHCPSVGYMAYLLTGGYYHLETAQFAHATNHFNTTDWLRGAGRSGAPLAGYTGASGVCVTNVQTRYGAWWLRSLIQALKITPDADSTGVRTDLIAAMQANCLYYSTYYSNAVNNPFGIVEPAGTETYGDSFSRVSMFQQDFMTAVWGWAKSMALPIGSTATTQLGNFFAWKAQSVVGRLGTNASYWYINAATYTLRISSSTTMVPQAYFDGTGPWAASWAEVYTLTNTPPPAWLGSTEGTLVSEFYPETGAGLDPAMWHNMQPAIAYAVRHGVSGASAAYARITTASNWSALAAGFSVRPGWGMKPLVDPALPAWIVSAPLNTWNSISGTAAPSTLRDYSGLAWRQEAALIEAAAMCSGGHQGNLTNNEVKSIRLDVDAPAWVTRRAGSSTTGLNTETPTTSYMPSDGRPAPRHTYWHNFWVPELARYVMFGAFGVGNNSLTTNKVDPFNPVTNDWEAALNDLNPAGTYRHCRDPISGAFYSLFTTTLYKAVVSAGNFTYSTIAITGATNAGRGSLAMDVLRGKLFHLSSGDNFSFGSSSINALSINPTTGAATNITLAGTGLTQFNTDAPGFLTVALTYNADDDEFALYNGKVGAEGRIFIIKPNNTSTWDITVLTPAGTAPTYSLGGSGDPLGARGGVQTKFEYISRFRSYMLVVPGDNIRFVKRA